MTDETHSLPPAGSISDVLLARFRTAGLGNASSSRLDAWLREETGSPKVERVKVDLRRARFWRPWPTDPLPKIRSENERWIIELTPPATRTSLVSLTALLVSTFFVLVLGLPGVALATLLISLAATLELERFRPALVELGEVHLRGTRGKRTLAHLPLDEVEYVEIRFFFGMTPFPWSIVTKTRRGHDLVVARTWHIDVARAAVLAIEAHMVEQSTSISPRPDEEEILTIRFRPDSHVHTK